MSWLFIAVLPAVIAATAAFLVAIRVRPAPLQSRPTHPVLLSVLAGMLWPVLVVGLTEFAIVMAMPRAVRLRSRLRHSGVAADTTAFAQR